MKVLAFSLTLTFLIHNLNLFAQPTESRKSEMFCSAIANVSTAPNYVVVTVKNLKTGEKKEICTEAPFLEGAFEMQYLNQTFNCKKHMDRYFEFSKNNALQNVGFYLYSKQDLFSYASRIQMADIIQKVKNGKLTNVAFEKNGKQQVMFAHLMFNNGVMVTRNCVAGNMCKLTYFKGK